MMRDIRTDGQGARRTYLFSKAMCIHRKGRVLDRNVYDSIHGQKGKVIAYNEKIAEQVVIHNLLKLRFFYYFCSEGKEEGCRG